MLLVSVLKRETQQIKALEEAKSESEMCTDTGIGRLEKEICQQHEKNAPNALI